MSQSQKKAILWNTIGKLSSQALSIVVSLIVARLLLPSDYGLIAILTVFIAIAEALLDSGFENALVQKSDRTNVDFSTVFYFNVTVSTTLYLILFFAAIPISHFYNEPQLIEVTRIYALIVIIQGLAIVQRTKLMISLRFKEFTQINLIAVCISGFLGITLAWHGMGVYALLCQNISMQLLCTMGLWFKVKWKPDLVFSTDSFKQLFSFGSKLLISGMMHRIYTNLYSLIIGKFYAVADVGFFTKANSLSKLPSVQFTTIITQVSYPALCNLQNDDEKLKKQFYKYLRLNCFVVFPAMVILASISKPLISVVLTERWLDMVPYMQILCIAYMFEPIQRFNWYILNVKGRSDLSLSSEAIKKSIAIFLLIIALQFGVVYICYSILLYSIIDIVITIHFVKKVLPWGYWDEFKQIYPYLIASVISGAEILLINSMVSNCWTQLVVGILGVVTYWLICRLYKCRECNIIYEIKHLKS